MGGFMIFIIVLVIILVLLALCVVRIVPQAYAMVIERLGGYLTTWNVGTISSPDFSTVYAKKCC